MTAADGPISAADTPRPGLAPASVGGASSDAGEAPLPPIRDNPYFGLDYYSEEDRGWFFGREDDGDDVITNLLGSRLTLLHAESGVGKSSLLRAGVARQLLLAASADRSSVAPVYLPLVFSDWKDAPVLKLIDEIRAAVAPLRNAPERVDLQAGDLSAVIEDATEATGAILVLILDQFEEYFLYAPSERPAPGRFADELARCVNRFDLPVSFLISIREEAYAGLGEIFKGRIANVYGNYLYVDYLDRKAAEDAIRSPLGVYNEQPGIPWQVGIEDELVEEVLKQVRMREHDTDPAEFGGSAGVENGDERFVTTLLQLVMETVWNRERDQGSHVLRASTLRELEGAERIVDLHLNRALAALSKEQRRVAIDALDHLVTPDGGKIAASIAQLAERDNHSEHELSQVLETLDHERVVRSVPPPPGKDPARFRRYEIFHDVLGPAINRAVAIEDQRRAHEGRRQRRLAWVSFRIAGLTLAGLIAAVALAIYAIHQSRIADKNKKAAQSLELSAFSQETLSQSPSLSTLLALRALKIDRTAQADLALRSTMFAMGPVVRPNWGAIASAFFTPGGKFVVIASTSGNVGIWSVTQKSSAPRAAVPGPGIVGVALDPVGGSFVTANANGTASIWRFAVGSAITLDQSLQALKGGRGPVTSVAFSPDGKLILTADADGSIRLWSAADSREVGSIDLPVRTVNSAMFSPDGQSIVTAGSNGTADVLQIASQELTAEFATEDTAPLNSVAFSPDGTQVLAASGDGSAWIWNVESGKLVRELRAGTGSVYSASYNPKGTLIVTTSADGTARIWDVANGKQLAVFRGSFANAMFSPDGRTLVTAGFDGTARLPATGVANLTGPLQTLEQIARQQLHGKSLTPDQQSTYLVGIGS